MAKTADEWIALANSLPQRPLNVALHTYIDFVRANVNAKDALDIPETHKALMHGENHEGSSRLNTRIRQLAAWFTRGVPRVRAVPGGPGELVRDGARSIERFVRQGERMYARGTAVHNYRQECARDLAECGFAVFLQTPRKDYYDRAEAETDRMADGSSLAEVVMRRRIDPATFSFEEKIGGVPAKTCMTTERHLGELSLRIGFENASKVLGYLDLSEAIDESDVSTWDISVVVSEVWTEDEGALVFMAAGAGTSLKAGAAIATVPATARVLHVWPNNAADHPPVYIAKVGPQPWHSPLDEMVALTNARNFWATMLDIQASGAIFRHWQLVDKETGDQSMFPRDAVPEHLLYDISKPPPDMGPGTEWKLAPFEFHDVVPRYTQIRADHEEAGASVARLSGHMVNQNTPVGTADFIDDAAHSEFGDWVTAIENQHAAAWYDLLHYLRTRHKDPVFVIDKKRDPEDPLSFMATTTALSAAQIVTEEIEFTLDMRSPLSRLRDYREFVEKRNNGDMDYRTGVELGLIPGVDDADAELAAMYASHAERIIAETRLRMLQQQAAQAMSGSAPQMPDAAPNIAGGARSDPRGTGTGRGPVNVSDTALAAGASDLARPA